MEDPKGFAVLQQRFRERYPFVRSGLAWQLFTTEHFGLTPPTPP